MARKKDERLSKARADRKAQQHGSNGPPSPHSGSASCQNGSPVDPDSGTDVSGGHKTGTKMSQKHKDGDSYMHSNDDHFTRFRNQLYPLGLMLRDIPGDGNCLFRAIGDQIEGHGANHFRHRMETVRYMIQFRDQFAPFIEDDVSFEHYIDNLARPGTYAGQDSLVAFSRLHKVNIVIHQLNSPLWRIDNGESGCKELHLSYHNGEHYSSVRRVGDNSNMPANVCLSAKLPMAVTNKSGNSSSLSSSSKSAAILSDGCSDDASFSASRVKIRQDFDNRDSLPLECPGSAAAFMDSATEDDLESGSEFLVGTSLNNNQNNKETMTSMVSTGNSGHIHALPPDQMTELVMTTSNCYDVELVQQALAEHQYNIELTVDYLVNLMIISQAENGSRISSKNEINKSGSPVRKNSLLESEDASDSARELDYSKSGAKPKINSWTRTQHLSNKQRQDLKKLKRREKWERQRELERKGRVNGMEEEQGSIAATFAYLNL